MVGPEVDVHQAVWQPEPSAVLEQRVKEIMDAVFLMQLRVVGEVLTHYLLQKLAGLVVQLMQLQIMVFIPYIRLFIGRVAVVEVLHLELVGPAVWGEVVVAVGLLLAMVGGLPLQLGQLQAQILVEPGEQIRVVVVEEEMVLQIEEGLEGLEFLCYLT
jgi:hypothetical protein